MWKILSFIGILYLEQQYSGSLLQINIWEIFFSNTFFSLIFRSQMKVHTAEKDQIKYFAR